MTISKTLHTRLVRLYAELAGVTEMYHSSANQVVKELLPKVTEALNTVLELDCELVYHEVALDLSETTTLHYLFERVGLYVHETVVVEHVHDSNAYTIWSRESLYKQRNEIEKATA